MLYEVITGELVEGGLDGGVAVVEWMDFSLTQDKSREEILRALNDELKGGTKTVV